MAVTPQIVAMGGGGFSEDDALLDRYILDLVSAARPRVCFLPTASGDADAYVARFYRAFPTMRFQPSDLTLFPRRFDDLRAHVLEQDVVYVGGGSTANLLSVWRVHGLDRLLREAWERGVVLAGISAGANCWFEASTTDSFGPRIQALRDGLGLISGSFAAHCETEPERRPVLQTLVQEGFHPGYAAGDRVAIRFVGSNAEEVVASRADSHAYRIERSADGTVEELRLVPRLLS